VCGGGGQVEVGGDAVCERGKSRQRGMQPRVSGKRGLVSHAMEPSRPGGKAGGEGGGAQAATEE
jgi:hypothetical protein